MARSSVNFLPSFYRTDKNSKFLSSTLDQFISEPKLDRLNGFIGSKLTPNYIPSKDQYIPSPQGDTRKYQLEPSLVIYDTDRTTVKKAFSYNDLINQLAFHGADTTNLDKLFRPDYLAFDPQIEWDKLINFREYYWLPTGPAPVRVTGTQREVVSTFTVTEDASGRFFIFTPDGLSQSPQINLYRGTTYVFNVNTKNKLYIKTAPGTGPEDQYSIDIIGNGTKNGQIIITVSNTTPTVLFYASDSAQFDGGQMIVQSVTENSIIDVEKEIVGKVNYTASTGIVFTNGLHIDFGGDVFPEQYRDKTFIVEGVGNKITLVDYSLLDTPEVFGTQYDADFDAQSFDTFPFDNFKNVPIDPSYITINRSSLDLNPWTRYNRWYHVNVLTASAKANGVELVLPVSQQAKRPIVEFKPNLQLYNFGNRSIRNVTLIDNQTRDAFSDVEASFGYWVDGVQLEDGNRVIFNADTDPLVKGRVYVVSFVNINGARKLNLTLESDGQPTTGLCVAVEKGNESKGTTWWFSGKSWIKGQQKTTINQAPVFDVFDENGVSYSSSTYTSNFRGTRIFGYAEGTVYDPVLGLNLKYQTAGLESSYLFETCFNTDTIIRTFPDISAVEQVSSGLLRNNTDLDNFTYGNVWSQVEAYAIPIVQFQVVYDLTSRLEVLIFDNPGTITDITANVTVNNLKYSADQYTLVAEGQKLYVEFAKDIPASANGNKVRIDFFTEATPNSLGYYTPPLNLTNNPTNNPVAELTLSELYDQVSTMVERDPEFTGSFPGASNLGDLPYAARFATRIILNNNPLVTAQYFISNKENNVIDAVIASGDDYNQFKQNLIKSIGLVEFNKSVPDLLDQILVSLNENKNTTFPYFLSDMVPYGSNVNIRTYTVTDTRNTAYPITDIFNNTVLSNKAVLVYLNGSQLIVDQDYVFEKYDSTITFLVTLNPGDVIKINEYKDTDGCYIAPTPSKLSLYPKFQPTKYLDTTYASEPKYVIQGHDGSITVAFNDYRDDLLLEYETRVYNNIKTEYRNSIFDINTILPSAFRKNTYSYTNTYKLITGLFKKWTLFYGIDYEKNLTYDVDNHKTYNYKSAVDYLFNKELPGSWRAIYKYLFDTDRPDTHPWEMLGISVKPDWWDSHYGPAPYTSGNLELWTDLEAGYIAGGQNIGINTDYARPGLSNIIPVDESGNTLDIRTWASIGLNDSIPDTDQNWAFGDWGPAENAWRRSSNWPFAVQIIAALSKPADYCAGLFDTSRIGINKAGQLQFNKSPIAGLIQIQGDLDENGNTIRAAGFSVYVVETGKKRTSSYVTDLKNQQIYGEVKLMAKLGGFVSKDKLNVIIDSVQLDSKNPNPYLPPEDFNIHFNISNPIKTLAISGIILIKSNGKFIIRGYDKQNLFFKTFKTLHQKSDPVITVSGKDESYVTWTSGRTYQAGQVVFYQSSYYRVVVNHIASINFDLKYFSILPALPVIGGVTVQNATQFETTETNVSYGTEFTSVQEVADFMFGYGKWLETQGFIFDDYSTDFQQTIDWSFTVKEFLYWTTQNWADNSVITLSPFANQLKFNYQLGVVDNVLDSFYEYSLLKADGTAFPPNNFSFYREAGTITVKYKNTFEGLYFARLNIVQKEHAIIFNNTTVFNDIIYRQDTGYRQLRVKLEGFRTSEWTGDFFSPGFTYDSAEVKNWTPYQDYQPADLVRYVGKYYSALNKISGTLAFDFAQWQLLPEMPTAQLLPNFDYKINQFEDFYSLDIDNFDMSQQKMAQHLTGYSPRSYLNNIFDNPISQYKFYQGYIKEKGTLNAITKLEKASSASLQGKLSIYEEWAFRIGAFGGYSSYNEIEMPLREQDFIENSQLIKLVSNYPNIKDELVSYILPTDLAIVPTAHVPEITFKTVTGTLYSNNLILPHAGYVRLDDVQKTVVSSNNLTTATVYRYEGAYTTATSVYSEGDKVWVAFDNNNDWNVYRFTRQLTYITSAELGNTNEVIFATNKAHGLKSGDLVSISKLNLELNGVYAVAKIISLTRFSVVSAATVIPPNLPQGLLNKFEPVRFKTVDAVADLPFVADINEGELFWVDDTGAGQWGVLKKQNNYTQTEIFAPRADLIDQQFADKIVKQSNSSTLIIASTKASSPINGLGRIYVYDNSLGSFKYITNYGLNRLSDEFCYSNDQASFGESLLYDETDDLIFAGAPRMSNVKVSNTGTVNSSFSFSPYTNLGLVKISGFYKSYPTAEIPYAVISCPNPSTSTYFGSSMVVQRAHTNKRLLVGAPGVETSGTVYRYDISVVATDQGTASYSAQAGVLTTGTRTISALFNVTINDGRYGTTLTATTGTGYSSGTVLTIAGDQLGGITPRNDLIIRIKDVNTLGSVVSYVTTGTGARRTFTINKSDIQARLDRPPVIADYGYEPKPDQFGYSMSSDADATRTVISSPGFKDGTGAVHIYSYANNRYKWTQTIPDYHNISSNPEYVGKLTTGDRLGEEVIMSEDGKYLFISSKLSSQSSTGPGKVWAYKWNGNSYAFLQLLDNPSREHDLNFGHAISINSENTVLTITSQGSNLYNGITFDKGFTTFDGDSCQIGSVTRDSGTAYVYNRYNEKFLLAQELFDSTVDNSSHYGKSVIVDNNTVYVGSPGSLANAGATGSIYLWDEIDPNAQSWKLFRQQEALVDIELIRKASTINGMTEEVVDYLDIIDPLKGRIPSLADQELKYKTPFDPAVYNSVGNTSSLVVEDTTAYWAAEHVGELWWDLSTIKYVWYEQGDQSYRKTAWAKLFPGVSVDIYEWVSSTYTPAQWATLADTNDGLSKGISGQPKFANVYSTTQIFDTSTQQFTKVYFFWVKNKTVVPAHADRRLPSTDVRTLLTDAKSYGLRYLEILSADTVALTNFKPTLISDRIYLNVGYDNVKTKVNKHTEWVLVQENNENSQPPKQIERKLIDSLLGKDSLGNSVPDPRLPARQRYGVEIRPRQSMFINRIGALQALGEYVNTVLAQMRTRGFINFKNLNSKEEIPDVGLGEYDNLVETIEARDVIVTDRLVRAALSCTVVNGRITSVTIENPGYGYRQAPSVMVLNVDRNPVKIKTVINEVGAVVDTIIENSGYGFVDAPNLLVRAYTAIVQVDPDFNNKWSKYEWNESEWIRIHTQNYDTTLYWTYIDWKAPKFNPQQILVTTIEETYQLDTLELLAGDYVKVNNPGDGYYVILSKTASGVAGTFNTEFDIVYSESGTIQLLAKLWDTSIAQTGFDFSGTFDQTLFDQMPDLELQRIISAINSDIFVGANRLYYNKLLFKMVKYALTEQKFLDWAFKTAFITVDNEAGVLDQRPTYRYQNSSWYEDYLNEVKPYHTKVRNYRLNYQIGMSNDAPYENTNNYATDFDLPAIYDKGTKEFGIVNVTSTLTNQYPHKAWADNYGFEISNISISNPGNGYRTIPRIDIIPAPGDTGVGAKAVAHIAYGKLRDIEIINSGKNYKVTPTVLVVGGGNTSLTTATLYPQLSNSKVRSTKVAIKFDRVSNGTNSIIGSDKFFTEQFTSLGNTFVFPLTWYASTDETDIEVTLNGILMLKSDFYIRNYTEYSATASSGYHKKFSELVLTASPVKGQVVRITYKKNIELYTASERIRDYYNPIAGMPGKNLGQLMEGVDYPGVRVDGLPFAYSSGYDVLPFEESSYANDVDFYSSIGITATFAQGTDTVVLANVNGITPGQYVNILNTSSTMSVFTASNVYVTSINSTTNSIKLNSTATYSVLPNQGSVVEFWSFNNASSDLDTLISGGSWTTSTPWVNTATINEIEIPGHWNKKINSAYGIRPSDIILDGDKFLTPYTSHAPEEVIPGEVLESLSISVFTRVSSGSPLIVNQSTLITDTVNPTVVNLTVRPASTSSVMINFENRYLTYGIDYVLDFTNSTAIIAAPSAAGVAGITVVGVGGSEILGSTLIENALPGTADIATNIDYKSIGSAYVTVNGETLTTSTTGLGYRLEEISSRNKLAKLVVTGLTESTNVIQAWFFQAQYKGYSEVKEQIIEITESTSTFELIQTPGMLGPFHGQAVVELDGFRLTPPSTTYYEVTSGQTVFDIRPGEVRPSGYYDISYLEVYINGIAIEPNQDWQLDKANNQINFNSGYLAEGDVMAIAVTFGSDYLIYGDIVYLANTLTVGSILKVTTFTNHNTSNIRTEVFAGSSSNQYKISRQVLNDSYVWVSVGGKPLINKQDYRILSDLSTVEINQNYTYDLTDKIVITSFSDVLVDKTVGFRIFKDIFGATTYKRYSAVNTAFLAQDLMSTDTEIIVDNGDALPTPLVSQRQPGVVFIQGERIEYYTKSNNIVGQLRRGTMGTGIRDVYYAGTAVIDSGVTQTIQSNDRVLVQSTTCTSNTFVINPQATSIGDGIVLTPVIVNGVDYTTSQIEVYYAGRLLSQNTKQKHNVELAYDSGEHGSVTTSTGQYSVDIASQTITLNMMSIFNTATFTTATITVKQKVGEIWSNNGTSLLSSNTAQAQFLLERQSGLPDKYQYGKF